MSDYQSEIHKLLKLHGSSDESHVHLAPEGLPILHQEELSMPSEMISHSTAATATMNGINNFDVSRINFKSLLIYPVIFAVAFMFFFVVLNFPSIWAQVEGMFAAPQSQQILGSDSAEYYKWISNYFYAVKDPALLAPTADIDKDGLTNYDEFILKTNPIVADSSNSGTSDGVKVINGMNLWGDGPMTPAQRALVAKLDLTVISNRISGYAAQNHSQKVASDVTSNYDLDRAGRLSIPKLKLQVPLIWSKDPSNFDNDLTLGVIHYPGTALPGQSGIVYVPGHSSDYLWKKNPMSNIFAKLNFFAAGDDR